MADTIATYIGNGTQTDFSVPFDYLKKSFVRVYLDETTLLTGGDYGDTSVDYYFLDNTTVRLKTPPANGVEVTIRRYTSATERIVSFEDASILKATDLDTSQLQAFHIAEEARDQIQDAMLKDNEGNWDAQGNRIVNVGDPVDGKDAINLDWYNEDAGKVQENANKTEQWRNEAEGFRNEAETFRDEAEDFRDDSKYWANQAQASAGIAVSVGDKSQVAWQNVQSIQQDVIERQEDVTNKQVDVTNKTNQVNSQYNQVSAWTQQNQQIQIDVSNKHGEITNMYNEISPKYDTLIDNIQHVENVSEHMTEVTHVSTNMDDIKIVGGDLEGSFSPPDFTDMGRVGTGSTEEVEITGGNIKTVADNISDVQKVGDLIDSGDVDTVINSVETTAQNVTLAQQAQQRAESARDAASASAIDAGTQATLAKSWAIKMDGTVDGTEYSSKYWAQQAKNEADTVTSTSEEITAAVTKGLADISSSTTSSVQQVTQAGSTAVTNITGAYNEATENLETATQSHISEVTAEGTKQVGLVRTEGETQVGLVEAAGTEEVGKVNSAGTSQISAVNSAGETQIDAVDAAGVTHLNELNTAKTTAVKAVTDEGTKQVGLVTAEGNKQIPLVTAEGNKQVGLVIDAGTTQVAAVSSASSTAQATINTSVQKARDWAEKTDGPVEEGKYSAKYWADQASFGQIPADWNQTDDTQVDFIKNKPDLSVYVTTVNANATYATKQELSNATTSAENNFALKTELTTGLAGKVDTTTYNADKATFAIKTEVADTYVTKTELSTDISELATEVDTKLDTSTYTTDKPTFALKTDLNSYLTTAAAQSTYATIAGLDLAVGTINSLSTRVSNLETTKADIITDYGRVGS